MLKMRSFLNFIAKNKICWAVIAVFATLLHASMLLGRAIGIDSEALMYYGRDFYQGWLNSGRQGLVMTKMVIMGGTFNPYVCGALTLIFAVLACIMWTYLFAVVSGQISKIGILTFSAIICSHTIITEQMYFRIQSAEIMLGFAFTAISILWVYRLLFGMIQKKNKIITWLCILIINLITFSMYQVMIPLYIFGCVAVLYLQYINREFEHPWIVSFKFAGIFILTFAVNEVITLLFFNGSAYLGNQIFWGRESVGTCIYQIISHMVRAGIIGKRVYFVPTYIIFIIILLVLTIKISKGKNLFYPLILFVFTGLAPFYMTILCGGEVVIRAQLVLPFTIAFIAYVLWENINVLDGESKRRVWAVLVIASIVITLTHQSISTIRLNHTDKVRFEQDEKLAYELIDDINKYQNEDKSMPVAFVGRKAATPDTFYVTKGDVIGYSFFDWDTDPEPYSYHSTLRIIGFMSTLGTTYVEPDTANMEKICEYSKDMSCYPEAGSISVCDETIVVKLSDREE